MKIYKEKDKIVVEIPFWSKRVNPYMLDENGEPEDVGEYPTLTGIIRNDDSGNEECGFSYTIDRAYKDKGDDVTDIIIHCCMEKEKFIELCKKLGIDVYEYPICAYCQKSIFGCFTMGEKGNMCNKCESKEKKENKN